MIVRMARTQIVGPRRLLANVIAALQTQGIVHLRPLSVPLASWVAGVAVRGDPQAQQRLEEVVQRLQDVLRVLPSAPAPGRSPVEAALDPEEPQLMTRLDEVHSQIHALDERRAALDEERAVLARYEKLLVALAPLLHELEGAKQIEALGIVLRRKEVEAASLLEEEVARITGGSYTLIKRDIDAEHEGGLLAVPKALAPAVGRLLFEKGIAEVKLPESYAGRPFTEGVKLLIARRSEIGVEIERCEADRQALGRRWHPPLAAALREGKNRLARLRAVSFCGQTRHAFVVVGWAPDERVEELRDSLNVAFDGRVSLFEEPVRRGDAEEVPVVLKNPGWLRPFELLLALQPLPRYGSIDPTPFLAFFFPLFFGLILGDVGHGALAMIIALIARRRGWGGATGRKVATIAMACAGSAIFFGILFGEFFGELGAPLGMRPILLDRRHAMMPLLAIVVALGAAQIALGLALGFVASLRQGHPKEAIGRLITLAVIADVVLALLGARGILPHPVTTGALIAAGPLVVGAMLVDGMLAPLELVRALGNILSYARIMAVGMASVMLAEVANRLADVVHPLPVGIGLAVVLHTVNFALGLLSPAIQALRLQYVEFFDKFFVPGGRAYAPLSLAT